jgi:hypothetical protein
MNDVNQPLEPNDMEMNEPSIESAIFLTLTTMRI